MSLAGQSPSKAHLKIIVVFEYVAEYLTCRDQEYVNKHKELLAQNHLERSPPSIVESYDAVKLSINEVSKESVDQPLTFLRLRKSRPVITVP